MCESMKMRATGNKQRLCETHLNRNVKVQRALSKQCVVADANQPSCSDVLTSPIIDLPTPAYDP